MKPEHQLIYDLEYSLLTPEVRKSATQLQALIADEFIEHGSSGLIYNKSEVIEALLKEEPRTWFIDNFSVMDLLPEVMLATYKVRLASKISLRVSVWRYRNNCWQMVFHQGTSCQGE